MVEQTASAPAPSGTPAEAEGGLRERKKRQTRRLLSDTATAMFLARGFDEVRVSEIAEACGVSEKTVFNYFPTKESLLLDRLDATSGVLLSALADPAVPPVEAAVRVLAQELTGIASAAPAGTDFRAAADGIRRFGELLRSTPSLRAHRHAVTERLTEQATEVLAARGGWGAHDPEPRIAAVALLGLWQVQLDSMRRHLEDATSAAQLAQQVGDDVRRAAVVLENGLRSGDPGSPA
jgi:AcrR family transcriptional regulator